MIKGIFDWLKPLKKTDNFFVDQGLGIITEEHPCGCFGAHIAKHLNIEDKDKAKELGVSKAYNYADGQKAFEQKTGLEIDEISEIFYQLNITQGEDFNPFSDRLWLVNMDEAIDKLIKWANS